MRVAHVFPYDPRQLGLGFDAWVDAQLERWPLAAVRRSRHAAATTVHVVGPRSRRRGLVVEHRALLSGPRFRDWGDDWSRSLARELRSLGPEDVCVVHLNDYRAARLAERAAARARVVLVLHGRGTRGADTADAAVVLREDAVDEVPRARVLTPSVDRERFAPAAELPRVPLLGFVGRMERSKGVLELPRVLDALPDARVEAAGAGAAPRHERLTALGELPPDALAARLRGWRALLVPSYTEGFGLTVLEALSARVPVAAVAGVLPRELEQRPGVHVGPRDRYVDVVQTALAAERPPPADWIAGHGEAAAAWDELLDGLPPWRERVAPPVAPLGSLRTLRPLREPWRRLRATIRRPGSPSGPT